MHACVFCVVSVGGACEQEASRCVSDALWAGEVECVGCVRVVGEMGALTELLEGVTTAVAQRGAQMTQC